MANAFELSGNLKINNPVPTDDRDLVDSLQDIETDPTYHIGYTGIYDNETSLVYTVTGGLGTGASPWRFETLSSDNSTPQPSLRKVTGDSSGDDLIIKSGEEIVANPSSGSINLTVEDTPDFNCKIRDISDTFTDANFVGVSIGEDDLFFGSGSGGTVFSLIRDGSVIRVYTSAGKHIHSANI